MGLGITKGHLFFIITMDGNAEQYQWYNTSLPSGPPLNSTPALEFCALKILFNTILSLELCNYFPYTKKYNKFWKQNRKNHDAGHK